VKEEEEGRSRRRTFQSGRKALSVIGDDIPR